MTNIATVDQVRAAVAKAADELGIAVKFDATVDGAEIQITFTAPDLKYRVQMTPGRTLENVAILAAHRASLELERTEEAKPASAIKIPPLIRVKSSSVAEIGYGDNQLFVRFAAGKLYRYPTVTPADFAELGAAPSIGRALGALQAKHKGLIVPEADGA